MSRHGLRLLARAKSWGKNNVLAEVMVPGGGGLSPLCSRCRHCRGHLHQQNKGYQPSAVAVNRHDLVYGKYYGQEKPSPDRAVAPVIWLACNDFRNYRLFLGRMQGAQEGPQC